MPACRVHAQGRGTRFLGVSVATPAAEDAEQEEEHVDELEVQDERTHERQVRARLAALEERLQTLRDGV